MKMLHYLKATLLLAASASASFISIGTPSPGQSLVKGQPFVVQLDFPTGLLIGVQHVSVVIGLQTCDTAPCPDITDVDLGQQVLFAGRYDPKSHGDAKPSTEYQNFTLTLPNDVPVGNAKIKVAHFFLNLPGTSHIAELETTKVNVTISA